MSAAGLARSVERRIVTVLFADLTGYTALCQDLDPEDVALLVRPVMERLRGIAEGLGAAVPGLQGDGFMAVLGAIVSREDDVLRAVLAGARMQQVVAERRATGLLPPFPPLRVAVHLGEAVVSPTTDTGGVDVTGDVVNVASRLCSAAADSEVLVSAAAARLLSAGGAAWLSEARPRTLRGRRDPVVALGVDWRQAHTAPLRRDLREHVPLVARSAARAALAALVGAPPGPGRALVLVGEAGVG